MPPVQQLVVCDGDETGQELLVEALRVLAPDVIGFDLEQVHFDLSLQNRRATANGVVRDAAAAMRQTGFGLKAATITPEVTGDVGRPRISARASAVRSSSARGAGSPASRPPGWVALSVVVVRMAVGDAYGAEEGRGASRVSGRSTRGGPSGSPRRLPLGVRVRVPMAGAVPASTGAPNGPSRPIYEGMLKEELDAAAARHPGVDYRPMLIDATYAGLVSGVQRHPVGHPVAQP